jgi:urea carboxylase
MVRCAAGESVPFESLPAKPKGASIQARIYAEDPAKAFQPSAGLLTGVSFPADARVDGWIEPGTEVTAFYDPLLAKVVVWGESRGAAVERLAAALDGTALSGIETNLEYLRQIVATPQFSSGSVTTQFLPTVEYRSAAVDVLSPGTQSTVQDYPGRIGYWAVGLPPSGPMDSLAFRLANRILGNPPGAPALELTMTGPTLKFRADATIAVAGADMSPKLDGAAVPLFEPVTVRAGQTLSLGSIRGSGARAYLAVEGGFAVPEYLGSRATFTLGGFGGHAGRALRTGDVLHLSPPSPAENGAEAPRSLPDDLIPVYQGHWDIGVLEGPHAAPDFFAEEFMAEFYEVKWKVHYNSARTGVRLLGPKPKWTRADGGEAGLHPSNIHDTAYAIGAVDFTGDMPIILGPDGPSLGGFVCPVTIATAELWKVGQLKPGDTVRFRAWAPGDAEAALRRQTREIENLESEARVTPVVTRTQAVLRETKESAKRVRVTYRRAGDKYLLVEYGPMALDLMLRLRVHLLMQWLEAKNVQGIIDLTPGIRSLQIHYESLELPLAHLLDVLAEGESALGGGTTTEVPSRVVHLPLSWDDPATQLAIQKYVQSVRADAPWAPSNIEFIRRINGLGSEDDVKKIVFDASYLVLGLGDVYLGAPVATPIDPRHRLVTTKYNPARTWTPENAVGIGGAYLCVYGMEGPGGYQFVGRTVQMYNRFKQTRSFAGGKPWLLRFFDRIRFYPVSARELLELREAFVAGRFDVKIEPGTFDFAEYRDMLERDKDSIAAFKATQQRAFDEERERWVKAGLLQFSSDDATDSGADSGNGEATLPDGATAVESHVSGSVWKIKVERGARVEQGSPLVIVESMKMEVTVEAPFAGTIVDVVCKEGRPVNAGQTLVVVRGEA